MAKADMAEKAANEYVRKVPHKSQEHQLLAFEDFVAGALYARSSEAIEDLERKLDFVNRQLMHMQEIADNNNEFYSLSIVRYMIEMLK